MIVPFPFAFLTGGHRYANAWKWQEERVDTQAPAALEQAARGLEVNQMKLVHAGDTRVAIGRTGKGYVAFQDRRTHTGGPAEKDTETYEVHRARKKIGA